MKRKNTKILVLRLGDIYSLVIGIVFTRIIHIIFIVNNSTLTVILTPLKLEACVSGLTLIVQQYMETPLEFTHTKRYMS